MVKPVLRDLKLDDVTLTEAVDMMTVVETGAGELMLVLYVHVVCAAANTSSQIFTVFQEPLTLSMCLKYQITPLYVLNPLL